MTEWLYKLPDDSRRDVLALQERRAIALSLAVGLAVDDKQRMTKDEAREKGERQFGIEGFRKFREEWEDIQKNMRRDTDGRKQQRNA